MARLCYDGLLRPAGWKRLPSIRRVTDLLATMAELEFKPLYFIHPRSRRHTRKQNKSPMKPVTVALNDKARVIFLRSGAPSRPGSRTTQGVLFLTRNF